VEGRAEFYAKKFASPGDFFNADTRRCLRAVWQALIFTERQHEAIRLKLAGRKLFSPREAFKFVDRDGNGALTPAVLRDAMALNGFFATEKEIGLVLNKFGRYADQRVTMTDWVEELAPRTQRSRKI